MRLRHVRVCVHFVDEKKDPPLFGVHVAIASKAKRWINNALMSSVNYSDMITYEYDHLSIVQLWKGKYFKMVHRICSFYVYDPMYFPFIVMQKKKKKKIMFVPLLRYVYVGGFNTLWQWLFISEIYKAIRISCNFFFNFFFGFYS